MLGVDLGLNVGSVTRIKKRDGKWVNVDRLVLKFDREKDDDDRIVKVATRYAEVITKMADPREKIAIEEPIYSWGRRNPKVFAKLTKLHILVVYVLRHMAGCNYWICSVNNKSAKAEAGYGGKDKEGMVKAYKKRTGVYPGHKTKYGMETLADSYFIALAGYRQWATSKEGGKD